ncbi:MAG TPA: glycosyltransferase [Acidiferrobacteraceae bacterium]|nr:glycosyltransferase [Acidiferrobacteraceae bacterium]
MRREQIIEIIYAPLIGGSETLALDLSRRWRAAGVDVRICCLYERSGALTSQFDAAGVPYDLLNIGGKCALGRALAVGRYLRKHRPRAVHVHHFGILLNVLPAALLTGCPTVVFTEHSIFGIARKPWMRRAVRWVTRFVSKMTCVSNALVEYFGTLGVADDKMALVYNGVDTHKFQPPQCPRPIPAVPRIIAVGRLVEEKDYPILLQALRLLKDRGIAFTAEIVGTGPLADALAAERVALGLTAEVQFLGRREDVAQLLQAADIYVLSSKSEGMPIALLEAMATALPVVATAIAAVPEVIVNENNGLLVPPADPVALADGLARLIADPALRARIGQRGLVDVSRLFSIESTTELYAEYLGIH